MKKEHPLTGNLGELFKSFSDTIGGDGVDAAPKELVKAP